MYYANIPDNYFFQSDRDFLKKLERGLLVVLGKFVDVLEYFFLGFVDA